MSTEQSTRPFRFFSLPAEVRTMIYLASFPHIHHWRLNKMLQDEVTVSLRSVADQCALQASISWSHSRVQYTLLHPQLGQVEMSAETMRDVTRDMHWPLFTSMALTVESRSLLDLLMLTLSRDTVARISALARQFVSSLETPSSPDTKQCLSLYISSRSHCPVPDDADLARLDDEALGVVVCDLLRGAGLGALFHDDASEVSIPRARLDELRDPISLQRTLATLAVI